MKSGRSGTGRAGRRAPRGRRSWVLGGAGRGGEATSGAAGSSSGVTAAGAAGSHGKAEEANPVLPHRNRAGTNFSSLRWILRQHKTGGEPAWIAENLNANRSFVEDVCAAAVRLHETDARRVWEAVGGGRSQSGS